MSPNKVLAALAATFLAALQGCQTPQATAPGDRSTEGSGKVGFRLAPGDINVLRRSASALSYQIQGPGMDTMKAMANLDTGAIVVGGVPCGTRVILVQAIDSLGYPTWVGSDTVEVNANQSTWARIVLHRPVATGAVVIDVVLDSLSDSSWQGASHPDTSFTDRWVAGSWNGRVLNCHTIQWNPDQTPARIACTRDNYFDAGDTLFVDTVVHRRTDTLHWCRVASADSTSFGSDTIGARLTLRCYRPVFRPWSHMDTAWQDSVVGTRALGGSTWCHPSSWSNDSLLRCFRGVYRPLPKGTCESIWYGNGFPQGTPYPCTDSSRAVVMDSLVP